MAAFELLDCQTAAETVDMLAHEIGQTSNIERVLRGDRTGAGKTFLGILAHNYRRWLLFTDSAVCGAIAAALIPMSDRGNSAIDCEGLPGDMARGFGCEEYHRAFQILIAADAVQRRSGDNSIGDFFEQSG